VLAPILAGFEGFRVSDSAEMSLGMGQLGSTGTLLVLVLVGSFAASVLANQFGFDGTAYAAHITAAVPGRTELRARTAAHAMLTVPVLLAVGVVLGVTLDPTTALSGVGAALAGYGAGAAVCVYLSV